MIATRAIRLNRLTTFSPEKWVIARNARSFAGRLTKSTHKIPVQATLQPVTSSDLETHENLTNGSQENFYALSSRIDPEFLQSFDSLAPASFNLAAYADRSHVIQQLVKLGVDLSKVEDDREMAHFLIHANFDRHLKPQIRWLVDHGIKPHHLGRFITQYPRVFNETLEILQQRIDYLASKKFLKREIEKILNEYPPFLQFCFTEVDSILGFIQKEFSLAAPSVRSILVTSPSIVSLEPMQVREMHFAMKEEMGWSANQIAQAVCLTPSLLAAERQSVVNIFDHLTNTGGIGEAIIAKSPAVLTGKLSTVKQRLAYLKKLRRDQFDPTEPLYVPLFALFSVSDETFATKYARTTLHDYDMYLKQL